MVEVSAYSGLHEECEVHIQCIHPYPTLDMFSVWVWRTDLKFESSVSPLAISNQHYCCLTGARKQPLYEGIYGY